MDEPIGKYRWCWAGAESGYGVPAYATSYYYNIRRSSHPVWGDMVQIQICDGFGKRWINVDRSDLIPL